MRNAKDGAGKSAASYEKHRAIRLLAQQRMAIFRMKYWHAPGVIIDMHAGDGVGVPIPELDLFEPPTSEATAELAVRLAGQHPCCGVILCEKKPERRAALAARFGRAVIIGNNAMLLDQGLRRFSWGIIMIDPTGPADAALEIAAHVSSCIRVSDFITTINAGAIKRCLGLGDEVPGAAKAHAYADQLDPLTWCVKLSKREFAWSKRTVGANGFIAHIALFTNMLGNISKNYNRGSAHGHSPIPVVAAVTPGQPSA